MKLAHQSATGYTRWWNSLSHLCSHRTRELKQEIAGWGHCKCRTAGKKSLFHGLHLKEYCNLQLKKKLRKQREKKLYKYKMRLSEVLWPTMDCLSDLCVLKLQGKNITVVFDNLTLNLEYDQSKTTIQNLKIQIAISLIFQLINMTICTFAGCTLCAPVFVHE